ncbi:PREDICTED: rhodopsin, GQ-coupled-like [Branchiostoma belcheri]|uniref:Rhodopsin, GQ-coupled-like n=1 Tax=Branchiostoma belcheri TaxID=7741 RepID=A0A6P5A4P3_BRABE|nr:PREDICTED: rhodopsin, GQ-coupled-like [Branchiostoma belcheri]
MMTIRTPSLRTPSNAMVAVQCGTDLVFALCVGPAASVSVITNSWPLDPAVCMVTGFLCIVCRVMSTLTLTLIAVNRCVVITTGIDMHDRLFTWRNTAAALSVFAAASFTFVLSCHAGGLEFGYLTSTRRCTLIVDTNSPGYIVFQCTSGVLIVTMVATCVSCYVKIVLYVRRSGAKLQGQASDARKRQEFLLTRNCGLLLLVFLVSWLFSTFIIIISLLINTEEPPVHTVRFLTCMISAHTVANPVIYGMTSTNYQTAMRDLLGLHCCCKNSSETQPSTSVAARTPEVPVPTVCIHVHDPPGGTAAPRVHRPLERSALIEETRL